MFFILVLWIFISLFKGSIIELIKLIFSLLNFFIVCIGLIYILVRIFYVNFFLLEVLRMIFLFFVNREKYEYGYFLLIDSNLEG